MMPATLRRSFTAGLALLAAAPAPAADRSPGAIVAQAPASDWSRFAPADLLVIELAGDRQVVIALAPEFAPAHVANLRTLAQARWLDGIVIERVQENYVVQWGEPDEKRGLPRGVVAQPPAEFDRAEAGVSIVPLPYRDAFALRTGYRGAFPVALGEGRAWLTHCYGMVGVGRGLSPDTGSGTELYAVIGQAPRALDRNIAVIGRVLSGIEHLSALPRGTAEMGFYADPKQRVAIRSVRLASDLPAAERPRFEWLRPESASFRAWLHARANRHDDFFIRPAGAIDLCSALPPVRPAP